MIFLSLFLICVKFCPVSAFLGSSRERMPAEVFRGAVGVTFEGEEYPAPIGWDTYLKGLYGDYMQLPPEDKRESDHHFQAYILSEEERK